MEIPQNQKGHILRKMAKSGIQLITVKLHSDLKELQKCDSHHVLSMPAIMWNSLSCISNL